MTVTVDEKKILEDVFSHHPAKDQAQLIQYSEIRAAGLAFATVITDKVPRSADRTAAIRKVREAVMTANAAIALDGRGV